MANLGLNKIAGAVLATSLGLIGLHQVSNMVFAEGGDGHHGEEHAEAGLSEQMCEKFAYCVEVAGGGAAAAEEEEVFDLGALLASADASRGERVFKGQCSTCHTIEAGGSNGTGPNLHNVVGADKAAHAGFNYSAALSGMDGTWTYENLNAWLYNPASYARGTSMSFAGLRKDPDRLNLIAYLAANTENAPAYPDPLPATEAGDEGEVVEGEAAEGATDEAKEATEAVEEAEVVEPTDTVVAPVEEAASGAEEGLSLPEVVEDAATEAGDALEEAAEAVEEQVEDVVEGSDN